MKGSDHKCSLNPQEFKEMVESIRTLETALGSDKKSFLQSEKPCFEKLGKSVVTQNYMKNGNQIRLEDLTIKVSISIF
jgi:sialic acid synthase SpsE